MSPSSTDLPPAWARRLLWIDCTAGAALGAAVLMLQSWLSELYRLPADLVRLIGTANLLYAAYSFSLAVRATRPRRWILFLVAANLAWAVLCLRWAYIHGGTASAFGLAQLLGEAVFVGGLAILEWRWRELLLKKNGG